VAMQASDRAEIDHAGTIAGRQAHTVSLAHGSGTQGVGPALSWRWRDWIQLCKKAERGGLRARPCWRFGSRQPARHRAPAARGGPPTGGGSKGLRPADALRHRSPASRRARLDSPCTPTLRPGADPNLRMAAARCEET
jgi:hypothetical protein